MNRFEQAVRDCTIPTAKLLDHEIHLGPLAMLENQRGDRSWVRNAA